MNEVILHPSRNFLDARNPSYPFAYKIQSEQHIWQYLHSDKVFKDDGLLYVVIDDGIKEHWYFAKTKQELFLLIKHHFLYGNEV